MKNIKRISPELHKRLFGRAQPTAPFVVQNVVNNELERFGLADALDPTQDGELPLPVSFPTAAKFFDQAAEDYLIPYRDNLALLSQYQGTGYNKLPNIPKSLAGKWLRLDHYGKSWIVEAEPIGNSAYCLDFETVEVEEGKAWLPSCCVALRVCDNSTELYVWTQDFYNLVTVVPFSGGNVITGWNVAAYDRQYLASEYGLVPSGNTFPDMMAMHIKNRGVCNQQIALLTIKEKAEGDSEYIPQWAFEVSSNGLAAAYKLYTGGEVDKGVRDQIIELGLPWVQDNLDKVLHYCITDVLKTMELWGYIYPEYSGYPDPDVMANARNPSPVSLAGHLIATTGFVALSPERWATYYPNAEGLYQQRLAKIGDALLERATRLVHSKVDATWSQPDKKKLLPVDPATLDTWEAQLDWTATKPKGTKSFIPKWYHKLRTEGATVTKRVVPLLLKMKWMGQPLLWSEAKGWHTEIEPVPHPEEVDKRNTSLFAKGMKTYLDNGQLSSDDEDLSAVLMQVSSTVIWKSMRKRVKVMKVEYIIIVIDGVEYEVPIYVPNTIPHGTVSGRQASKDLHVFSHPKPADPKKGRLASIGSGFMTMIQALPGYRMLTIDFDSQELKLFALTGCEVLGYIGSTPLAVMVEIGQAQDKTDFHSVNMALMGTDNRTLAKNCGYAMCYYVGRKTLIKTILKTNPELGIDWAGNIESNLRSGFQGIKRGDGKFVAGSGSDSYNILLSRANGQELYTLFGGCKLTRALSGNKDFLTTRFNSVIQGTGAVMLDHILVGTVYLAKQHNIDTRYMLSRHDEWCFHTHESQELHMAYVMQLVHCAVWAKLVQEMGLDTISLNMAYASAVQSLKVYLKSVGADTRTEDQPHPLDPGRVITKSQLIEWANNNNKELT